MEENPSPPSIWLQIPPELLTMIFDKLAALNIPLSERRNSILRCREVHPFWKSVMDSNLERRSLEYYSKWKPFNYTNKNVYEFPRLAVVARNSNSAHEWVHLPPQIYNASSSELKPFLLTRSLAIYHANEWDSMEGYVFTKVDNVFSKCGAHLSSLNLTRLNLPLKTLSEILSNTSNLKGITLEYTRIYNWEVDTKLRTSLPPLAHLQTFRIFYANTQMPIKNLYRLLLKPYSQQLVSIESDQHFGNLGLVFPSLQKLTVRAPPPELLKRPPTTFPALQYLSLGELAVVESNKTCIRNIHNFISHFSKTLVELHVDVNRYQSNKPIFYDGGFNEKLVKGGVFPLMKSFSIFCPQHMEELAVVKDMLRTFPNLEALKLLRFSSKTSDNQSFTEDDKKGLKSLFRNEKYWDVCRKLKSIVVESGAYGSCPFYTAHP